MEQVAVIHSAFEDKPSTVAFVEVTQVCKNTNDKLEYAYRWTQNIMDSWSLKKFLKTALQMEISTQLLGCTIHEDGMGLRSTSVGDQMLVGNKKYVVARLDLKHLMEKNNIMSVPQKVADQLMSLKISELNEVMQLVQEIKDYESKIYY